MVKINMMCGRRNFGSGWVHIDMADFDHIVDKDIYCKEMPDNSVDLVYCSHGIAYFDREEIKDLLKAWFRVLKAGGVLRIATPDWDVLRKMETPLLGPLYGKMGNIYHKTVYSWIDLAYVLNQAGYTQIKRYDHTKTDHPNTGNRDDRYDDHSAAYYEGQLISLNVECKK